MNGEGEKKLVFFKPIELSPDIETLLGAVTGIGELTIEQLSAMTGWVEERLNRALEYLERLGLMVRIENYVVFPSIS